jgi:hypothetical protein
MGLTMFYKIKIFFLVLSSFFLTSVNAIESGPGNGTDYVEVLFADAKVKVNKLLESISNEGINKLSIDNLYKDWLSHDINGNSRLFLMKFYSKKIKYVFQSLPCSDDFGKLSGICFYIQDINNPIVIISKERNIHTTLEQAMIMLLHEIGHFTGELNHLFLDEFSAEIVTAINTTPTFQIVKVEDTTSEVYASIFKGKEECDKGVSELAKLVKSNVENKMRVYCLENNLKCDLENAIFTYTGTMNRRAGVGYDMSVSCRVQGVVKGVREIN